MIDERELIALVEGLSRRELRAWVAAGWVRASAAAGGYRFDDIDVARVRLIQGLRRELAIDAAVLPLVLSLLDQVYGLRRALRQLAITVAPPTDVGASKPSVRRASRRRSRSPVR
ncbi:MAG: hypothetical protein FJX56_01390 [Alphaproteobacteria bacterium]|nr:hypothetical protein [Alphaproteobacteria bacterium]